MNMSEIKLESVVCNLCGNSQTHLLFKKKGVVTQVLYHIVQCDTCGLIYVNPRISKEVGEGLYEEEYFKGEGFDISSYQKWAGSQEKQEESDAYLDHLVPFLDSSKNPHKLLEIGFGTGEFLVSAKKRGFIVEGVDVSRYACKVVQEKGIKTHLGALVDLSLPEQSYDCVVGVELVEHVRDPKAFFVEVKRLLKPGGLFYHQTANYDHYRRAGASSHYVMPEGHLYYYTHETFKKFLDLVGFEILDPYQYYHPGRSAMKFLFKMCLLSEKGKFPQNLLERVFYSSFKFSDGIRGNKMLPLGRAPIT